MNNQELINHYIKYIVEEYQEDFVKDEQGDAYIKFTPKEFKEFARYIMSKVLYHREMGANF